MLEDSCDTCGRKREPFGRWVWVYPATDPADRAALVIKPVESYCQECAAKRGHVEDVH